ncbi:hypothetical protein [Sphingobacterium kitahiroshimense]|uniref:Uncharacterized protein n=1 Tax=Sphingobacterium kitahiroshimense TaxID=470446 RepID=A0ABV0C1C7_9SPHI
MKEILSILSSQLIFNIRQNKNRETINIRYSLNKSCDCVLCLLDSLQYQKLVQKLTKIPKGLENILICAFTHYQIGNYLISAKYYENSTKQAEKLNKPLLLAATQYSLSKLHNHINNNYWDNNRDDLLIKRLKGISLEGTLRKVNRKDRQFITWIFNTNFFTTTFEQITILVSKIRDNYYNQLNGGHSSNSHVWLLINKYAELESFLTLNRIPYNRFIEFNELSKIFIDGLFLSHAIRSKESSKLNEFDDWTIQKILFYGKSSDIKMYFYRYEMAELKYTTSSTKDSTFISLVNNFLENPNIVIPQFENGGNANYRFWDHYMKIFNNILILLAIIDLDVKVVLITGERLFNFLEKFKSYDDSYIDNLELFLRRKGQMLNLPTLSNYLNLYSTDQIYHNSWYVNTVLKQIIEKDDKLILNQILQEELIKNELDICNLCKTEHYTPILPDIYRIINNKVFKNKIKDAVETKLTQKFKTNLYYEYAINDVINYKIFLDKFIEGIPTTVNHANLNYLSDFDNNQCLNNLINLCYKNNVNLKDPNYQAFRGKSDYYDWLLNLNDFDYKKFNPNWVTAYPTIYYYREFAKYPIIKHQLVKILSTEKNIKVEKALIEIVKAETEIFKTN